MKILFLASSADWHVDLWVQYFTEDHEVYLFSDKEEYLRDQEFKNVKIFHSEGVFGKILNSLKVKFQSLYRANKLISASRYAAEIESLVSEYDIDIVHSHSLYYGYVASFLRKRIPVVFTPMGSDIILHAQSSRIYRHMAKKAFTRADVITGDSKVLQSKGWKVGARKERNYIIQNGVDSSVFYPSSNSLKQDYGVMDGETLIFSPRAITPLYNIDAIIKSLGQLKCDGYAFKCMFSFAFGDSYAAELNKLISKLGLEDNVVWLGYLGYREMAEHYNACDIVISIPSSDSSPKSVYEAMFCGKPIIISDLEWANELLDESYCVEKVVAGDTEQLSAKIRKLIDSNECAKELSANAIKISSKHFDYAKNMREMESIMLRLLDGRVH